MPCVLCRSARVKLTAIRSLIRSGLVDIGHSVLEDGAVTFVVAAPGVNDGSQKAGSLGTTCEQC